MSTSGGDRRTRERPRGAVGHRLLAVLGAAVTIGLVLAGIDLVRAQDRDADDAGLGPVAFGGPPPPVLRAGDGSTVLAWGDTTAPVLEIFTDYQCPECRAMDAAVGPMIKRLAARGRVRAVYRPFQFYRSPQDEPMTSGSARAANAALCAPAAHWLPYHETLLAHQTAKGGQGFTPADLIALGRRAGIPAGAFDACVTGARMAGQVERMTRYATVERGVREVPAAFLNGRRLEGTDRLLSPARLERAIHAARRR
ncbi:DsbA family protein [Actinomadura viridis]|uniref:DsbA family protein n=1 Tax=Actinomadura viridis TaxID=58110 RepID=UPI00367512E2